MQRPGASASSETCLAFTDHTEGAANAWAKAEIITPKQQEAVQSVHTLIKSAADKLRARMAITAVAEKTAREARAAFGVRDVILDLRVMSLSDALLNGPANRNRDSQVYRLVFIDKNAGEITRAKTREEPELVSGLVERFAGVDDFEGKASVKSLAESAVTKSIEARNAVDAAELAESKASRAEIAERLVLRDAIDEAYGILRAAFPGRREFVESFFPKREGSSKAGGDKDTSGSGGSGSGEG